MSDLKISEAGTVQFPMVKHAVEIGWTPLTPEVAKQKRGGEAGMLLRDELEAKLAEFNPWLQRRRDPLDHRDARGDPGDDRGQPRDAAWLRGERSGTTRTRSAIAASQLIDFEHPGANVFHVTWEWTLKPPARKGNRADVMFLVNGVPVCIVEHKNPKDGDAIERGDQAAPPLRDRDAGADRRAAALQRHAPARLLVRRHLERQRAATWRAGSRRRTRPTASPCRRSSSRTDFLRTLQHWILFYVEDGETRKSVLRQHQRRAIDTIVERCADPAKKRGLIWHTQGSGKTFTLLTAARLILEDKERFQNATVILVVDRTELEGQLKGWVERLLGEMQQQDIAGRRAEHQGRAAGPARRRLPRPDHLDDPQVRGDPEGQLARATTSTSSSTRRIARSPRTSAPT